MKAVFVVLTVALVVPTLPASDWPQFLGPDRNGTSPEKGLARTWPADGPKTLWTAPLGPGYGAAAVKDGKVYVLDRVPKTKDILLCYELATGKEQWTFAYETTGTFLQDGSRAAPTLDESRIYTCGPLGHVHCLDQKTQQVLWKTNLISDFDGKPLKWAYAQSPLLYKDWVILAPMGKKAGLAAFERATGRVVWRSPYVEGMISSGWPGSYASPMLVTAGGVDQIVFIVAQDADAAQKQITPGKVIGVSAQDGALLWSYENWHCTLPLASAVGVGEGRVFVTGAYDAGSALIKVEKAGERWAAREVLKTSVCGAQIQQPILRDGHLFVVSNGKERNEGLMCLTLDGKVKWHTTNSKFSAAAKPGLPNFDNGNMLLADGMLFIVDGKTGDLRLVEASTEGYKELACAKAVLGGKQIWAPMALADGKLLLRDNEKMKCLDVRAGR